jgi:hypothetical protein
LKLDMSLSQTDCCFGRLLSAVVGTSRAIASSLCSSSLSRFARSFVVKFGDAGVDQFAATEPE